MPEAVCPNCGARFRRFNNARYCDECQHDVHRRDDEPELHMLEEIEQRTDPSPDDEEYERWVS
jgi:predicted amidophosphoribosyltransferase